MLPTHFLLGEKAFYFVTDDKQVPDEFFLQLYQTRPFYLHMPNHNSGYPARANHIYWRQIRKLLIKYMQFGLELEKYKRFVDHLANEAYFASIKNSYYIVKHLLEHLCYLLETDNNIQRKNSVIFILNQQLEVCGPGVITALEVCILKYINFEHLFYEWCYDLRREIIEAYAEQFGSNLMMGHGYFTHVRAAIYKVAHREELGVSSMNEDPLAPRDVNKKVFLTYFNARYTVSNIIAYLARKLRDYLKTIPNITAPENLLKIQAITHLELGAFYDDFSTFELRQDVVENQGIVEKTCMSICLALKIISDDIEKGLLVACEGFEQAYLQGKQEMVRIQNAADIRNRGRDILRVFDAFETVTLASKEHRLYWKAHKKIAKLSARSRFFQNEKGLPSAKMVIEHYIALPQSKKRDETLGKAYHNQGIILRHQNKQREAFESFKLIPRGSSLYFKSQEFLGGQYFKLKDYENAITFWKNLPEGDVRFIPARYNLAVSYYLLQEYNEAKNVFNSIPQNSSTYNKARSLLGDCYFRLRDYNQAINVLSSITQDHPQYNQAQLLLGKCFFRLERYNEAKNVLEACRAIPPITSIDLVWWLGNTYFKLGKHTEAIRGFQMIPQNDSRFAEAQRLIQEINDTPVPEPPAKKARKRR